ncbi:MAG: hypothetical protein ACKVUT_03840 [Gaiella sp.]
MAAAGAPLFVHEVRREGRPVVVLRGVQADGGITVEAEVYPITQKPGQGGLARPFVFPNRAAAQRFVDESLTALQYLNCELADG